MYQSVDDPAEVKSRPEKARSLWPIIVPGLLFCGAVVALVSLNSPKPPDLRGSPGTDPAIETEARTAYLRSISEPDAALRRARLTDFLTQYSQHPLAQPTQAQLDVLDAVEAADWQDVLAAALDPAVPTETALDALRDFEDLWGGYLGGRDREITDLEETLRARDKQPEQPDRTLPRDGAAFPNHVPGDQLAGADTGDVIRPAQPGTVQSDDLDAGADRDRVRVEPVIIAARVRRDVNPRFPRSALRRGVDGTVTLSLNIDTKGRVQMVDVVSVEADRYADEFVRAAKRAARRTRFHPRTIDGEPTPVSGYNRTYRFEPEG